MSGSDDKKVAIRKAGHALTSDALGIPASSVKLDLDDGSNLAMARLLGRIARFRFDS